MSLPPWIVAPVLVLVTLAARADVRTRRIPNHLTFPALLIALVSHAAFGGRDGFLDAVTGMAIAGGVLLPGWLMGWMGAGDVKLVAAVGAWLGMPGAVFALLGSLVAGGLVSVVLAIRQGVLFRTIQGAALLGVWGLVRGGRGGGPPATSGIRFPFGVAVLAGSVFALICVR
ncbi:MAG: prepilin peptidase [Candidatus Eisenbacteria bacterium]